MEKTWDGACAGAAPFFLPSDAEAGAGGAGLRVVCAGPEKRDEVEPPSGTM